MKQYVFGEEKWLCKVFWAWQDEKEEKWLEEMSLKGWHLVKLAPFFYKFRMGPPRRMVYRLDYKMTLDKDYAEYQTIFNDSGWELVATMSNWHYYRIEPENERIPEIYNTNHARAQKYRRLLMALLPILVIITVVIKPDFKMSAMPEGSVLPTIYFVASILRILLLIILGFGTIKIVMMIRQLESGPRE